MAQDKKDNCYRGVKCLYCKQPIPISPRVAVIEFELQDNEITPPKQTRCQVFHLRCVACGKEKPYIMGEIIEFEGRPPIPAPHAEPTSSHMRESGIRPRAANA